MPDEKYPIGTRVWGDGFEGVVTAHRGPYSEVLDGRLIVPHSLIRGTGGKK